ncbi:MAG: KR domain-containing protein [Ornithinimicrobium sp.]
MDSPPDGALSGRTVGVLGGPDPLAAGIVRVIASLGGDAVRVSEMGQVGLNEWPVLRGHLPTGTDYLVDLGALEADSPQEKDWWPPLARTFAALRQVRADWVARLESDATGYLAVTAMGGHAGTRRGPVPLPVGGLWAGLAKGLPREMPTTAVRVLDVDSHEGISHVAHRVVAELLHPGPFEVGYAHGVRHVLRARAESVGPARIVLRPEHLVLITGGGRGIGFALAVHLARRHGAAIVVTGRSLMLADDHPWLTDDADTLRELRYTALRSVTHGLAAARRQVEQLMLARELTKNIQTVRAEGLPITYRRADVTQADQVAHLVRDIGNPTVVVHNAAVDQPGRLADKDPATVRRTVSVKLLGFAHLLEATAAEPAHVWCNVGSMTGRWGGMVGQLEYGAANEALARMAWWATNDPQARDVPVRMFTLAWPTWDRLGGMISNFEATLAYMDAMPVSEGLAHWEAELLGDSGGEVGFLADIGPGLTPSVLRGYYQPSGLPGQRALTRLAFALGEMKRLDEGQMELRLIIDPAQWPAWQDVTWQGDPMLTPGWAVEICAANSRWVVPPPYRHLLGLSDLDVSLHRLALPRGPTEARLSVRRRGLDHQRARVSVELLVGGHLTLTAQVAYGTAPRVEGQIGRGGAATDPRVTGLPGVEVPLQWRGHVAPVNQWSLSEQTWTSQLSPSSPASLSLLDPPPDPALPTTGIDVAIHALAAAAGPAPSPQGSVLLVPTLDVFGEADPPVAIEATGGCWRLVDEHGRAAVALDHPRLVRSTPESATARPPVTARRAPATSPDTRERS